MSVKHIDKSKERVFLQRVLKAMKDIDLLAYENFEDFYANLIEDLASQLNHLVNVYAKFETKAHAGVSSLTDKKLEQQNQEFLTKLQQYVDGVKLAFNNRAVKLCSVLLKLKPHLVKEGEKERISLLQQEIATSTQNFQQAIERVGILAHNRLKEAERLNLLQLPKYKNLFEELRFLESLDLDKALHLIETKGKIL